MDTNQQMGAINNNIISARSFTQPLSNFVSEEAICKGVRYHYQTNSEGEVIKDKIIAVSYWLVCPNTFTNYTLRVNSSQPVVTPEELETTTTFIELDIPTEECIVKPYKIEYGKVYVSITAPYVKRKN